MTLREGAEGAGVSVAAIRKWYRAGLVASRMEPGPYGPQRMVDIDELLERATARRDRPASPQQTAGVFVPSESWTGMLDQLGNLYELAKSLSEVRERAAKAEAEGEFLRSRAAELEEQLRRLSTEITGERARTAKAVAAAEEMKRHQTELRERLDRLAVQLEEERQRTGEAQSVVEELQSEIRVSQMPRRRWSRGRNQSPLPFAED